MPARFLADMRGIPRQLGQVDAMGAYEGTIQAAHANWREEESQVVLTFDETAWSRALDSYALSPLLVSLWRKHLERIVMIKR